MCCKVEVSCVFVPASIGAHGSDCQLVDVRNADTQLAASASVRKPVHATVPVPS